MVRRTLLHLSLISGVGPATAQRLCDYVGIENIAQIYEWTAADFCRYMNFSLPLAQLLVEGLSEKLLLKHELDLIERHAVDWCTFCDDDYPILLKEIQHPPIVLYSWGKKRLNFTPSVALVGSRKAHSYARQVLERLVPDFVQSGWSVVSGGALGADTSAHELTLDAGGSTCAVIGSGLLNLYPASNKRLFMRIRECGGAIVSPFPLSMGALPGNFPARNRIISGMSNATVVVQAAERSGALITAYFALEQGREVGAVPGPIQDLLSVGCHKLLKEGALVVSSALDVIQACGFESSCGASKKNDYQKTIKEGCLEDPIISLCSEAQSFDDILERLDCTPLELQKRLVDLQLCGTLEQDFMGRWVGRV